VKTIAFAIQKGGTGKTSTAGGFAEFLPGRVLLVDLDPQGNLSGWLAGDDLGPEAADYLFSRHSLKDCIIHTAHGFDMVHSFGIGGELRKYAETTAPGQPFRLDDLKTEAQAMGYHYLIFDLSPALGPLERAALYAADQVICPIGADDFSVNGLEIFTAEGIERLKRDYRKELPDPLLILNRFDKRISQHLAIYDTLKTAGKYRAAVIPSDQAFPKAQRDGVTLTGAGAKAETVTAFKTLVGVVNG
jgi:chromosome partitioning protein